MIQTRPYEFMVSYTPQRQWIEKGDKAVLAFFFIELGAGMFWSLPYSTISWQWQLAGFSVRYWGRLSPSLSGQPRFWPCYFQQGGRPPGFPEA